MNRPTEQLLSPSLASLQQSPSLLVYNDATFTDADFKNILSLGDSAKRRDVGESHHHGAWEGGLVSASPTPGTVGKYGLGFNVVYHLSDVVSFVSGGYLVVFWAQLLVTSSERS